MRRRWIAVAVRVTVVTVVMVAGACGESSYEGGSPQTPSRVPSTSVSEGARMPDLVGLDSAEAGRRLGELGLGSTWDTVTVRCEARPGSVVRQAPTAGAVITAGTTVRVRTARLDLDEFRGPCDLPEFGPVTGRDAALARLFYRFAADPSLGAPFVDGPVWTGIEDGPVATAVSEARRADLAAWRLDSEYAERGGPFSALDVAAASGGYYEVGRGVAGTCPGGDGAAPPELAGLRAITLTVPGDSIDSCLSWWAVTLFVDHDLIRGVALRLGSP
ncbi:PASTA domain-containing protein [Nocardioides sp.]|uniref:PASTA domain-containing protein n=1 Tax=Nocardioides sp. TaxID=35761 RepID=UPI0026008FA7|nr:PASTA domain-containing protein [Nocardioides sp.]